MQLDRVGSTLALHRTHACMCTRARARAARMFTEYVDPLSSPRHTYALARRSSFTPICLRSPGTIQPRSTGLDLLCPVFVHFAYMRDISAVQIISKNVYRLFIKILDIIDCFLRKELGDFLKIINYLYPYNKILFFINFF